MTHEPHEPHEPHRLHPRIRRACHCTDAILWEAFLVSAEHLELRKRKNRLVFPRRENADLRVSEHEARFAFVEALYGGPLTYSIEVPTRKSYQFSGKGKRSAQTDLVVRNASLDALCNVEFKAGGFTSRRKNLQSIAKDLEKLVREPLPGLWYHVLKGVNKNTISELLYVLGKEGRREFPDMDSKILTIHICVLQHRFSMQKSFSVPLPSHDSFSIDLGLTRTELTEIRSCNGWMVNRLANMTTANRVPFPASAC